MAHDDEDQQREGQKRATLLCTIRSADCRTGFIFRSGWNVPSPKCAMAIFDQHHDWRASISVRRICLLTNRYRGNNRGLAQKILKEGDSFGRLG